VSTNASKIFLGKRGSRAFILLSEMMSSRKRFLLQRGLDRNF
jgi:hypothetical protein